nr:transposase [Dactylosporangium thailandense]
MAGLLRTPGRKSIRNIAGGAGEQRLHHFVSDSTWDWRPVRAALRRHLLGVEPPDAWVVRSMFIPKAGAHSVGVARRFCHTRGAAVNAQHAVGVWAATAEWAAPVGWRLHLAATPPADCLAEAYLEQAAAGDRRPVVLDARGCDAAALIGRLRAAGAAVLARVDPDTPVWTNARPPGHGDGPLPASRLIRMDPHIRRPLFGGGFAAARPARVTGRADDLTLLGLEDAVWLTDLTGRGPAELARLAALPARVDEDLAAIGDRVGLRDYTGRSFAGWHRHVTLASAAHAVLVLEGVDRRADAA